MYGNVIEETRRQRLHLQQCQFQHVRREGNKLAHVLARRAVLFADCDLWVEKLPSDLNDVFQVDLFNKIILSFSQKKKKKRQLKKKVKERKKESLAS